MMPINKLAWRHGDGSPGTLISISGTPMERTRHDVLLSSEYYIVTGTWRLHALVYTYDIEAKQKWVL